MTRSMAPPPPRPQLQFMNWVPVTLNTPRPVRVWYNTVTSAPEAPAAFAEIASRAEDPLDAAHGYSLSYFAEVQDFASVIIIVDTKRAAGVKLDQLSDYIAVVGLSDNPQRDSRHVAWDCEHRCPAMRARVML